jgi:hypothetical protein
VPNTESVKGKDPLSMSKDSRVACFHFLYIIDTFKIDTLTSKGSIQLKPTYKVRRDSTSIETSSLRDDECGYNGGEIQEALFSDTLSWLLQMAATLKHEPGRERERCDSLSPPNPCFDNFWIRKRSG